ncbi:hypothetical protein PG984_003335 [Apiospora sp. TS-2023a]
MPGEAPRSDPTPYSMLEVSYLGAQEKTVVPTTADKIPNTSHDGGPAFELDANGRNGMRSNGQRSTGTASEDDAAKGLARHKRPRCGLSPVAFWALVVALNLLALGAIGGGIAAAVLRRESSKTENNPTSPTPGPADDGAPSQSQSQLSAVNWTDSSDNQHKAVFYQKKGKLWLSQNSAPSTDWTALDIGSQLLPPAEGEEAVAINPKNGTPLASVVVPAGARGDNPVIYLYYVDTGNTIRDIRTTATTSGAPASPWAPGELWGKNSTLAATGNTGLAALAHYCAEGCMNQNAVVFQKQGNVLSADGRDWSNITHIIAAVAGTSLALFPSPVLTPDMQKYNYSLKPQARLFYHREGLIIEAIFNDRFEFTWTAGYAGVIKNIHKPPRLAAAVTTRNARGLVLSLDPDSGNVTASYLPRTGWNAKEPQYDPHLSLTTSFSGDDGSGNAYTPPTENRPSGEPLAAIALTPDLALYTLSRDKLHIREYAWSDSDTNKFDFIGTVL